MFTIEINLGYIPESGSVTFQNNFHFNKSAISVNSLHCRTDGLLFYRLSNSLSFCQERNQYFCKNTLKAIAFELKVCYSHFYTNEFQSNKIIRAKNIKKVSSPFNGLSLKIFQKSISVP